MAAGCLPHAPQALYSLVIDLAEGVMGLAILRLTLRHFLPKAEEWKKWFKVRGGEKGFKARTRHGARRRVAAHGTCP